LNDGKGYFKDGTGNVRTVLDPVTGTLKTFSNYPMKNGPYVYNQELCDIDNDGDLDILLDNAGARPTGVSSGNFTQVLVNTGKGVFVDETRARIFGETGSDDNAVKCVDVNNDGNYDLLVASLAGQSEKLLLADGTGKFNMVPDAFPKINDSTLGIDATDFDGDGLMDVVTGQGEGRNFFQERYYHGVAASDGTGAAPDTKAPLFRAVEKPVAIEGKPIVLRVAVRDAATSETGDMVKDVSVVYSTPFGVSGKVKATYIGGDLFRAVIPAQEAFTTVTLAPQATDRLGLKGFGTPVAVTVKETPVVPPGPSGEGGAGGEPPVVEPGRGGAAGEPPVVVEPGVGGEPPVMGMAGMPDRMEPEPETGAAGEPSSSGATSGTGGTDTAQGGAPSIGGTKSTPPSSSRDDDGGCSVSASPSKTHASGWLSVLGLALALGRRRRTRRE
jgi:MYXO-CTERM domain-containing protein